MSIPIEFASGIHVDKGVIDKTNSRLVAHYYLGARYDFIPSIIVPLPGRETRRIDKRGKGYPVQKIKGITLAELWSKFPKWCTLDDGLKIMATVFGQCGQVWAEQKMILQDRNQGNILISYPFRQMRVFQVDLADTHDAITGNDWLNEESIRVRGNGMHEIQNLDQTTFRIKQANYLPLENILTPLYYNRPKYDKHIRLLSRLDDKIRSLTPFHALTESGAFGVASQGLNEILDNLGCQNQLPDL